MKGRGIVSENRNTKMLIPKHVERMAEERTLRFKIRRSDGSEIELEGSFEYVKAKFEEMLDQMPTLNAEATPAMPTTTIASEGEAMSKQLAGLVETTADGKIHYTFRADILTAKEAVALMLYIHHPKPLKHDELSSLLSAGWKTTHSHVVRARASELKREGRLIMESGRYSLSGAGLQWVQTQVIAKLRAESQ